MKKYLQPTVAIIAMISSDDILVSSSDPEFKSDPYGIDVAWD